MLPIGKVETSREVLNDNDTRDKNMWYVVLEKNQLWQKW